MQKKKRLPARLCAALLALVMVMTLAPTALAAAGCPANNYGEHIVHTWETVAPANCHEDGVRRGICALCGTTVYDPLARDPDNHDAVYTDEGNGYHSAVCTYHPNLQLPLEKHTPNGSGVCSKCGAVDYSGVMMNLPADLTVPVALNNAGAKLSVGEIKLTLGSASGTNVTDDYTIHYNWYYNGSPVASTPEYALPDTVTGKEGTYRYTLFVSAVPKSSLRDNVSGSCNVTVTVKDLISASATVSIDESSFYLGDPDSWSGESVSAQIYAAVQDICPRNADPDYIVFHTLPGSTVGSLNVSSVSTLYYFEGRSGRHLLDDVRFTVANGANATAGDYTVGFTAYDTARNSYDGVLVITVQQDAGDMDVVAAVSKNGYVTLSTDDFQDFWTRTYANGVLDSIRFKDTPRTTEGSLYVDYISASAPGVRVTTKDNFYVAPGSSRYSIDEVTFLPGVKQTEYITLDFEARGTKNNGLSGSLDGTLYLFIQSGGSADVALTVDAAGTALSAESFQKAYQSATGGTGTSFYIRLLDVPGRGALYVNRSASRPGTLLTQKTVASYPLSYSDSRGESISSVTYVPGTGTASETIRYVACSNQGKPLYTGRVTFSIAGTTAPTTPSALILNMTGTSAGVKLSAASFEDLPGALAPKLTMVSFTPPSASLGTFYCGRTATNPGTAVTSSGTWFSAVTVNPPAGLFSLDSLTFIPAPGVTGVIPIAFTATDASNNRYTGTLRITVTATPGTTTPGTTTPGTTTPGTTTPGTTTPGTTTPAKTFSDVPSTRWSYPYITALTSSGVLNGYEDGTFRPATAVTLGQALKMIMTAANPKEYSNLSATGTHWASGYLDRASKDGLLPAGLNTNLDRNVNRYTIAEIAAKALKLSPIELADGAASPFSDMAPNHASAKYVMPLYQLSIFIGSADAKTGKTVFYGDKAITREDFATVIWRMQSYVQTGAVQEIGAG